MPQTFVLPRQVALDDDANPLDGALLYFYQTGTTTPQAVYIDAALTTPHANPVVASASGEFPKIYLNPVAPYNYRARLTTAAGVQLYQEDDIDQQTSRYPRTDPEIAAGLSPINYAKWPSPWKDISRFVSDNTGVVDVTGQMQAAFSAERSVVVPQGRYKITSPIQLLGSMHVGGGGESAIIEAYGCDAIRATSGCQIENLILNSYSAAGVQAPRLYNGITCPGVSGAQIDRVIIRDVLLTGWDNSVNLQYCWNSILDRVETVFTNVSVRLFGVCANDTITNSRLTANGGTASIRTVKDGVFQGEGLMISGTLLSSGQNGILSDGFLSIGLDAACIVDLIQGVAFDFTGVTSFKCDAQWVYAEDSCFLFRDPGTPINVAASICIGRATTAGAINSLFRFLANNSGLSVIGGEFSKVGVTTGYPFFLDGSRVAIIGARIINGSSNPSIYANAADIQVLGITGDKSVEWNVSPIPSVASATTIALPTPNAVPIQQVAVTGTTSVTTINDVAAWKGKTVILTFDNSLTVNDGGNLRLSANFSATADDALTLTSNGTVWIEVGRSNN